MNSNLNINQAVDALKSGEVIAYPTEAVYGLGCDPWNEEAIKQILDIKQRPWQKGLIIVAANLQQLQPFIAPLSADTLKLVEATWPGPTTWILPASEGLPACLIGDHDSIAVRVTAHPQTADLCRKFGGPVVSTSANRAGEDPAKTQQQVQLLLPEIKHVLSGECLGADKPTEIRDATTGEKLR